ADLGNAWAMFHLSHLYEHGGADFPVDLDQAKAWLLKAAELGNARAIKKLEKLSEPQPAKNAGM
ncbi:SEL1-like repeat protein, partial [Thalassotalea sp. G20_0]|uniref:SEL1-like repeat protein n=1 Tax=Thalassotalea sp. G20_0 TaxID=2821093 RepID=UPI001AD97F37